ncbi:MAG: hypothetical protein QXS85_05340 [Acidilobaceae archaeon]
MRATKLVAIAAHSGSYDESLEEAARRLVASLTTHCGDVALLLGGYWGLMKVVADEALSRGLTVVILPPLEREHESFPEKAIVVRTGVSYRVRSVFLARSCDAMVALGGAAGVIQEAVTAYTESKTVFLLKSGLDSDKLEALAPYLDYRRLAPILVYSDPESLARDLCAYLSSRDQSVVTEHG